MLRKDIPYSIAQCLILWIIGGLVYMLIEILYRGRTHWSMAVVGGLCFILIGALNEWEVTRHPYTVFELQAMIGAIITTVVEFISGIYINLVLGWDVWDYSDLPFNVLGQICLPFTFAWVFIAAAAIILDDFLRHVLFMKPFPTYWFTTTRKCVNLFGLWESHVCKHRHKPK